MTTGMYPSGFTGIQLYASRIDRDRSLPPVYAGRKHIISDIEDLCKRVWERRLLGQRQPSGAIRLIYGAPGAGKTSTLDYLRTQWNKGAYITSSHEDQAQLPTPQMLRLLAAPALRNIEGFCEDWVNLIDPGQGDSMFVSSSQTDRRGGRGGVSPFIEGRFEQERTKHRMGEHPELRFVKKMLPKEKWLQPLVIGFDETQNLHGDDNSPAGVLLQELHENLFEFPVVVLMAGLSDSTFTTSKLGLTRLAGDACYSLDRLDDLEINELKTGFCAHFEIDLKDREVEFESLLQSTEGWPSHIQNSLQAFAIHYVKANGDIDSVNFSSVEKLNAMMRENYYRRRRSKEMKVSDLLVATVMSQLTGTEELSEVIEIIELESKLGGNFRERLPDNMTAKDFYEHLIHQGALQERGDDLVDCPIPSFRNFLINNPGSRRPKHNTRRDQPFVYERATPNQENVVPFAKPS